jgi:hypothetical protein
MTTKSAKVEQYERAAALTAELTDELCKKDGKRLLFPPQIAAGAVELLRLADRLQRYAEAACNYQLTINQEHRVGRLEKRVREICQGWGIGVKFNGDPRGYVVRLMLPNGSYNTWGGKAEGWGI